MPQLEITEVILFCCNVVNNSYQQKSRVLYTFVPNKCFGQLLDTSIKNFLFLKPFDSDFSYIEAWFADQNSKPLGIEDKINITLVTKQNVKYNQIIRYSVQLRDKILTKIYGFFFFAKDMGKNIGKNISKNLNNKYRQKFLGHGKKLCYRPC